MEKRESVTLHEAYAFYEATGVALPINNGKIAVSIDVSAEECDGKE